MAELTREDTVIIIIIIIKGVATYNYEMTGTVTGTWYNGTTVDGVTVQLTVNTGTVLFSGQPLPISGGNTDMTTVPEPGTLSLLSTGLIGAAGIALRKMRLA